MPKTTIFNPPCPTRFGPRLVVPLLCVLGILCVPTGAPAQPAGVAVFPSPGSHAAQPASQIAFRGLSAGQIGLISVTGSSSGVHSGVVLPDSDGNGGSFAPTKPFVAGETVVVHTGLNVLGGTNGTFQFTIATPAGLLPAIHWPPAPRVPGDVWRFHSRHDLAPPAVAVTKRGPTAPGDIFLAPQYGPEQDGLELLDPGGGLIWFRRLSGNDSASDFRVQNYLGKPVVTWWQGSVTAGVGNGADEIMNDSYQVLGSVRAANGLGADLHEFEITPQNTALITAYNLVYADASAVRGSKQAIVLDSVVQEIDIPTGLVLFQWDSLDHVPIADTYQALPQKGTQNPFDYFHVNSVEEDRDGNLLISGRNTFAAYKVDHRTGAVIWRLGGRHSSFKMGPGATFAFQHDVRVRANNDMFVTIFDDGAGPPTVHSQSRALKLRLDLSHMTATNVSQHEHSPALLASFEGNYQQLPGGEDFIGWGSQPYVTEYNSRGQVVFDAHFVSPNAVYRSYRLPWSGTPTVPPAIAASTSGGKTSVYASWNGATNVASWRVLGGSTQGSLRSVAAARKRAFETAFSIRAEKYVQVQALDASGNVIRSSATICGGRGLCR
jgi:Arylsulfotransferase (ASST)